MAQRIVVPDDPEKAFRQAMHRLEEQQARNQVKERKKKHGKQSGKRLSSSSFSIIIPRVYLFMHCEAADCKPCP